MLYNSLVRIKLDLDRFNNTDRASIFELAVRNRLNNSLTQYYKSLIKSSEYLYNINEMKVAKSIIKETTDV